MDKNNELIITYYDSHFRILKNREFLDENVGEGKLIADLCKHDMEQYEKDERYNKENNLKPSDFKYARSFDILSSKYRRFRIIFTFKGEIWNIEPLFYGQKIVCHRGFLKYKKGDHLYHCDKEVEVIHIYIDENNNVLYYVKMLDDEAYAFFTEPQLSFSKCTLDDIAKWTEVYENDNR